MGRRKRRLRDALDRRPLVRRGSKPVIAVDAGKTLELVRTVSFAGRGEVAPQEFLDRVCDAVSGTFGYDDVAAVRFQESPAEPSDTSDPALVARALKSNDRVLVSDPEPDGTSVIALPLLGATECLGVLFGKRRTAAPPDAQELDGLATLGIVVSSLLENAIVQERAEQLDVLKSEFIALAAHELRSPLSAIYGACVTLDERGDALARPERVALAAMLLEQATRMRNLDRAAARSLSLRPGCAPDFTRALAAPTAGRAARLALPAAPAGAVTIAISPGSMPSSTRSRSNGCSRTSSRMRCTTASRP